MKCLNCERQAWESQPFCSLACACERYAIMTEHAAKLETLITQAMEQMSELLRHL